MPQCQPAELQLKVPHMLWGSLFSHWGSTAVKYESEKQVKTYFKKEKEKVEQGLEY